MTNNKQQTPHGFCETPEQKCTMNYCDENGCQNRKRTLAEPIEMTDNKQQTAVEWYAIEMGKLFAQYHGKIICIGEFHKKRFELENQAKEMEKEQAIKLYYEYELYVMMHESDVIMNESSIMTFGQFYKQTYGGGEQ